MSGCTQVFVGLTFKCFVALFIAFFSMNNTVIAGSCDWIPPTEYHTNYVLSVKVDSDMLTRTSSACKANDRTLRAGDSFKHIATTGDFFYGQNPSGLWGWTHKIAFAEPNDVNDDNPDDCIWESPSEFHTNYALSAKVDGNMFGKPSSTCVATDRSLRAGEAFTHVATDGDFFYGKNASGLWGWVHKITFEEPDDVNDDNPDDCIWESPSEFHTNYALSAKVDSNMLTRPSSSCAASDRSLRAGEAFTHIATDGDFFYGENASGLWGWAHRSTFEKVPSGCFTNDGHIIARPGTCVGVPDSVNLVDYSSDMNDTSIITISDSDITIEGKRFIGCVRLTGNNVTFKNNYVECYRSRDNLNSKSAYSGSGPVMATGNGTTIEYNTLVCKMRNLDDTACDYGVFSGKSLVQFNDISGSVDGVDVRAGARVQFNYIHDFGIAYEQWREKAYPNELTHYSHADGVQLYAAGSGEILIEGNLFKGMPNEPNSPKYKGLQGMLLAAGGQQKPTVRIINNMIGGYWPSLRIACMGGTTCEIEGNVINERYNTNSSAAINLNNSHSSTTVSCNYFTDGQLVEDNDIWQGQADNSGC